MRPTRLWMAIAGWLLLETFATAGTTTRKPGLWEITTTTTWQKAPEIPGDEAAKLRGGTRTTELCLTQEMIDDYGALLPQGRGQCSIQNRVTTESKTTGDYLCSGGMMEGKGRLESTWTDPEHVQGTVHFTGTFLVGSDKQPIEWTTESRSRFKSESCGAVKPHSLPHSLPKR